MVIIATYLESDTVKGHGYVTHRVKVYQKPRESDADFLAKARGMRHDSKYSWVGLYRMRTAYDAVDIL